MVSHSNTGTRKRVGHAGASKTETHDVNAPKIDARLELELSTEGLADNEGPRPNTKESSSERDHTKAKEYALAIGVI